MALLDGPCDIIIVKLVGRRYDEHHRWNSITDSTMVVLGMGACCPVYAIAVTGDEATHEADHALDAEIIGCPEVHVHGLPLNKDQQVGPVPKSTPWPAIPLVAGREASRRLDEGALARVKRSAGDGGRVGIGQTSRLTIAGIIALNKWTFAPAAQGRRSSRRRTHRAHSLSIAIEIRLDKRAARVP